MTRRLILRWLDSTILDLGRQLHWSYLPPLLVYLAAGVSGLTSIVGAFFIKEYLGLSAAFLSGLAFWAGIPWVMKMPLGHLVDLVWRWKAWLVYLGAALIAASIGIMYGLIANQSWMLQFMPIEVWYVASVLLAPSGYVIQDVVADAMTVEAVPTTDSQGARLSESDIKAKHTTMQTLGRFSIVTGLVLVSGLNIFMFDGVDQMTEASKADVYAQIYLYALAIPLISIAGVGMGGFLLRRRARQMRREGLPPEEIEKLLYQPADETKPNWWIFGGSLAFAAFTLGIGLSQLTYSQEVVFIGSMMIVLFLMHRVVRELAPGMRRTLVGTALIIFAFRAVPLPGPGATWFEIDVLGFDQQFISILTLITSALALTGMVILRPMMAKRSIAYVVALLTIAAGVLSLPNIGLYYGLHEWTSELTAGIVDAHFIAILDTAVESPLAQISMIPMLAWIAKNSPPHLKATFFAVMASFTNLALSASSLGTRYLNEFFVVSREVRNLSTGEIEVIADYGELGWLLIVVALITLTVPLLTIVVVQNSPLRTRE